MNNATQVLPGWGEMPTRPGLYLSLSRGRDFPQQTAKSRGFAGPKIGPLLYVQTQCGKEVTLRFASQRDAQRFFPEATLATTLLHVVKGALVYADKCYAIWDICYIAPEFCRRQ